MFAKHSENTALHDVVESVNVITGMELGEKGNDLLACVHYETCIRTVTPTNNKL